MKLFTSLFATCFTLSVLAFGVSGVIGVLLFGKFVALTGVPRMYMYHAIYPIQYLAVASFAFAGVTMCWIRWHGNVEPIWRRRFEMVCVFIVTLGVAGAFCGLLYSLHDMQTGFFPHDWISKSVKSAIAGPVVGGFVYLISVPYNLIQTLVLWKILTKFAVHVHQPDKVAGNEWMLFMAKVLAVVGVVFAGLQFVGIIDCAIPGF